MDLEFSAGILETPSLITPSINVNPMIYKISSENSTADVSNNDNNVASSNSVSVTTANGESSIISSAEIKLSKIKDELIQSFSQPRKPTESIFQKMAKAGVLAIENVSAPPTLDDGIPADIPSTADVSMNHKL